VFERNERKWIDSTEAGFSTMAQRLNSLAFGLFSGLISYSKTLPEPMGKTEVAFYLMYFNGRVNSSWQNGHITV